MSTMKIQNQLVLLDQHIAEAGVLAHRHHLHTV